MPSTYFVADSSRICGDLCGFIGGFGRFHLDESGADVKMNGMGCLDGLGKGILTEEKGYLDGKTCFQNLSRTLRGQKSSVCFLAKVGENF